MHYRVARSLRFLPLAITASLFSIGISTITSKASWDSYWNGTIYRVQTVDFNILSHTLPTKLSALLIAGQSGEIQKTINSNYGLFGIVITDCKNRDHACPSQNVLYISDSKLPWRSTFKPEDLDKSPYNLLHNPPPLFAEGGYDNSRDETWDVNQQVNGIRSQIIGRVYYVRGTPPDFWVDYQTWLKDIWSNSGSRRNYLLLTSTFVSLGLLLSLIAHIIIEMILKSRIDERNKAAIEKESLNRQVKQFREQLRIRILENRNLIDKNHAFNDELTKYKLELESYQATQQLREDELKREFDKLTSLRDAETARLEQQLEEVAHLKRQLSLLQAVDSTDISNSAKRQEDIDALQNQIQKKDEAITSLNHIVIDLTSSLQKQDEELHNIQISKLEIIAEVEKLRAHIENLNSERNEAHEKISSLENQLSSVSGSEAEKVDLLAAILEEMKVETEHLKAFMIGSSSLLDASSSHLDDDVLAQKEKVKKNLINLAKQALQSADQNELLSTVEKLKSQVSTLKLEVSILSDKRSDDRLSETEEFLVVRPPEMSNIEFAERATIELYTLPQNPKAAATAYYKNKNNGSDNRKVTLDAVVAFLRHQYTNYEDLCDEFSCWNERANATLKSRCNCQIYSELSKNLSRWW